MNKQLRIRFLVVNIRLLSSLLLMLLLLELGGGGGRQSTEEFAEMQMNAANFRGKQTRFFTSTSSAVCTSNQTKSRFYLDQ